MKLFSKTTACICAVIIATSAATVISVNAAKITAPSTSSAQTESSKTKLAEENIKYGKVTAVDGNKITVALGEFAAKTKTTDNSTSSEKAAKKKKSSDSTEAQSGDSSSAEKTVTKKHRHKGKHSGSFTENGTSLTVTVTNNITIEKKGETAAVSDISEGDIVKLTYSDSGELTGVKLKGHKHSRSTDGTSDSTTKKKSKRKTSVSAEENTTET